MKYLNTLIVIISLVFALPVWSEESAPGFNFEEMENLNVLLCTDANNKNNKKAFAISKNKDGTFEVFSDNFGLIKLTEVEKDLILNIPQEATMLLFNKRFTDISGLLAGESFKADCFDITAEIALLTEYFSTGAMTEIVRLTEELRQNKSELSQASNRIERLVDIESRLTADLKVSRDELQKIKVERGKLVTTKYNLLDEVKNLKEDNSNYLNRLNEQVSKILNLKQIVDEQSAFLMDSQKKLKQEESKFKNASNKINNLLNLNRDSDEKLRLKEEQLANFYSASQEKLKLKNEELANFKTESGKKTKDLENALKRNGIYEEYFENSGNKIKLRSNYKNGQLDGVVKQFAFDGYLLYYETKKEGKSDGFFCNFFYYHRDEKTSPIRVLFYKNGGKEALDTLKREEGIKICKAEYEKPVYLNNLVVKVLRFDENFQEKKKIKSLVFSEKLSTSNIKIAKPVTNNTKFNELKSEFHREARKLLEMQEGVTVSGDRFVFSSEILFSSGEAVLSEGGKKQIKQIANLIFSISDKIPSNINWILRVDGHTDDKKIRGGKYKNNWELSQARALSVVLYMQEFLYVPAFRLAATGFGEYQPVNKDNSDKAREENRRIEIKLTER